MKIKTVQRQSIHSDRETVCKTTDQPRGESNQGTGKTGFVDLLGNRKVVTILMALSFIYLLAGFNQGLNIYDEGLCTYGAKRILDGDVPYTDFWTIYAPGQFYLLAGLYKIFGLSLLVGRIWTVLIMFALSSTIYLAARKLVTRKFALISWLIMVIWLGYGNLYASPMPAALLFCLCSALCLFKFLNAPGRKSWLILSGLSVGMATLFRHDIGFYTLVSEMLVIVSFAFVNLTGDGMRVFDRLSETMKAGWPSMVGMTIALLPAIIYFAKTVPLNELLSDLIIFPATIFPKVRSLPFPPPVPNPVQILSGELSLLLYAKASLNGVVFYFPPLIFALSAVRLVIRSRKKLIDWNRAEPWFIILLILLGLTYFNQARVRSDSVHIIPALIPAAILFASLLQDIPRIGKYRFATWVIACLLGLSILPLPARAKVQAVQKSLLSPSTATFSIDHGRGISYEQAALYQQALEFIKRNVPENEKIFVGNSRHDRIFINDMMFYFLSDRHSATKYHELHPGLVTTAAIQKKIVDDIERQNIKYVVLRDENKQEPNGSGESSGVKILDDHIQAVFAPVRKFGDYTIWKRGDN